MKYGKSSPLLEALDSDTEYQCDRCHFGFKTGRHVYKPSNGRAAGAQINLRHQSIHLCAACTGELADELNGADDGV